MKRTIHVVHRKRKPLRIAADTDEVLGTNLKLVLTICDQGEVLEKRSCSCYAYTSNMFPDEDLILYDWSITIEIQPPCQIQF